MKITLNLRDRSTDEHRQLLFDALAEAEPGDELELEADRDVDPHLVRYQIERDRSLDWEYAHLDEEPREPG